MLESMHLMTLPPLTLVSVTSALTASESPALTLLVSPVSILVRSPASPPFLYLTHKNINGACTCQCLVNLSLSIIVGVMFIYMR